MRLQKSHGYFPVASTEPPGYDDLPQTSVNTPKPPSVPALHPRIAVILGVSTTWYVPLLVARALSTAPAMWWGLRCAFTFLGDLLLSDGMGDPGNPWTVEKRFRVTEVFLAILWVRHSCSCHFFMPSLETASKTLPVFGIGVSFLFLHGLSHG